MTEKKDDIEIFTKKDDIEMLMKSFTTLRNAFSDPDMFVVDLTEIREEKVINSEPLKLETKRN